MTMEKYELQKLRELPIEAVAERLGLQVKMHKALCPFHDDSHPSLSFSVRRNTFRCFVCGASGGTIDLVMKCLNMGFREACRWLADEHNVIISDIERVVRWCRLTSWKDKQGVPWLQIPYYDREGRLVGVQNRNLVRGATPRFRFPTGSECGIYNLPVLNRLKPGDTLFITEGCSDCWAMLSAGHKAIAIPSATLLKPADKELLSTLNSPLGSAASLCEELSTNFHMYPDRDAPGERLFLQLQEVLPALQHHQLPPGCKDFSEYYIKRLVVRG